MKKVEGREGGGSRLPAFRRKFTNRGQGEKKIWQQAVSLVPNIEQLRSIARRFFGCQKWWRARHARKPFSLLERRAKNRTSPFSSEFEAACKENFSFQRILREPFSPSSRTCTNFVDKRTLSRSRQFFSLLARDSTFRSTRFFELILSFISRATEISDLGERRVKEWCVHDR